MKRFFLILLTFATLAAQAQRTAIAPMLKTKWGQDDPFNMYCPQYNTNNGTKYPCKAGCVAVAMAQIMYYYRYPAVITKKIPGYPNLVTWSTNSFPFFRSVTLDDVDAFSALDWDNMCEEYKGDETNKQKSAVANAILYAGTSVLMKYDRSSSADPRTIVHALTTYFGYGSTTRYVARSNYSDLAWDELIYQELAAGRPVIYGGLKENGSGHSFIIDGYRTDGLYHVNWGSDGTDDGYFPLNQMDPNEGIDGYNYQQDAIIGIQPIGYTDIESLQTDDNDDSPLYDLTGRPVDKRTLKKGLYLKQGRKIVVRPR